MASVKWGELTAEDLAQAVSTNPLVILPLGCTEQHALHLPVDTDTYQVERLTLEGAALAAERHGTRVLVLPTLPFGPASEHYGLAGTISMPNEVYVPLLKHLLWSVIDLGFRRIILTRGCGGHWVVPGVVWDVKAEAARAGVDVVLRILSVDDHWHELQEKHFPGTDGGHAAVMETALCLAEREQLVKRARMDAPELQMLTARYREGGEAFLFSEMSNTGALGDPRPATVAGGRAIWQEIIEAFADRLRLLEEQDRELDRL